MSADRRSSTGTVPNVLAVAGSDSGAGAGIQADLKTFAAFEAYGCSAVTAITARNTESVRRTAAVPAAMVEAQMEAVFGDIRIAAVKTGLLPTAPDPSGCWSPADTAPDHSAAIGCTGRVVREARGGIVGFA